MEQKLKNSDKKKKYLDSFAKYSNLGFQMGAIIFIGVFGGVKIDKYLNLTFPIFTIILSLLSVMLSIYIVIKDLLK